MVVPIEWLAAGMKYKQYVLTVLYKQVRAFFWNAIAFMILLYTNAKALESANVETVIVFRTLSIFATAYADFRCDHEICIN